MSSQPDPQTCVIDPSYCKFGCQTTLELLGGFLKNLDGVVENKDVECVHKTRVASRKLRAALPIFEHCFPAKRYKRWLKEVKKVTKLLGEARDLDVQITFVQEYLKNVTAKDQECVGILLADRVYKRKSVQPQVDKGIEELKATGVLKDLEKFCLDVLTGQSSAVFDPNQVLVKARWHISLKLDDFLALKKCVYREDANQQHHQMRINAKKLRYTMEFFAPLYKNKLKTEIETVKSYQDILGEKHDLEVWIEYLPKFMEKAKKKNEKINNAKFEASMQRLLASIKAQRIDHYRGFVAQWKQNLKENFFESLRETTKAGPTLTEEKTSQALSQPGVKVAVLSDVHANLQALEAVFADAQKRGAAVFINAGDSVGFGPCPNEVVELLCEKNVLCIQGNYDVEVLEKEPNARGDKRVAFKFAENELADSCRSYLQSLPRELRLQAGATKLLVTHGSPMIIDEHVENNTPPERLAALAEAAKADVIIVGHSHQQLCQEAGNAVFLNPGSVGRPGDGNPQAAYAILQFNPFKAEMLRVDYDVGAAAEALRRKGLPESLAQMLLRGVSIDEINKEDEEREKTALENCRKKAAASEKFAKAHEQDEGHCGQVTKLALAFFDGLSSLHGLGEVERCWLECAAVMHDVGLSEGTGGHNKKSAILILNAAELPFSSRERRIIASAARYHRKGLPKPKHYNLRTLDRKTVRVIKILSGILRAADGLDYTHRSNVKAVEFTVGAKRVTAKCVCEAKSPLDELAFNKKKDLFERVFAKKLVLVWKPQTKPRKK